MGYQCGVIMLQLSATLDNFFCIFSLTIANCMCHQLTHLGIRVLALIIYIYNQKHHLLLLFDQKCVSNTSCTKSGKCQKELRFFVVFQKQAARLLETPVLILLNVAILF